MTYIVKEIHEIEDDDMINWLIETALKLNMMYWDEYDLKNFNIRKYLANDRTRVTVCFDGDKPKGIMMARLMGHLWDNERIMYEQDLLYAESPKATYLLMKDFIDFGRNHADDIITMIAEKTRLKRSSLEKLGFKKLEEVYRIEV